MVQHYRLCKHYAGYEHHHNKGTEKSINNQHVVSLHLGQKKAVNLHFCSSSNGRTLFCLRYLPRQCYQQLWGHLFLLLDLQQCPVFKESN